MQIKKPLSLLLALAMLMSIFTGCGTQDASTPDGSQKPEKTAIQSQEARFVPIEEVGAYNSEIITEKLLKDTGLTDVDKSNLPYWTGYIFENKATLSHEFTIGWEIYNAGGHYFCEDEVRYLAENGFNCVRVLYGFSILSNPEDVYSINISELEQLDELISWCLKYDIHMVLSITGLPGIHSGNVADEDPSKNYTLFTDSSMQEAFTRYWDMISKRYAEIPNGVLSFEIVAEPGSVGIDENETEAIVERYCEVLEPIALNMFADRADRIVFAMDIMKLVPERLAEIGCCLSLHNHVYSVNAEMYKNDFGIEVEQTYWPMPFVPMNMYDGQEIVLQSQEESGFTDTTLSLGYGYFNYEPELYADGELVPWENATGRYAVYESGELYTKIPEGTKELRIVVREEFGSSLILLEDADSTATIAPLYINGENIDFTPSFLISADGDVNCSNEETASFGSWDYMYATSIKLFEDCAKKHGVSFVMTEIGTDTLSLSPEDYIAYHEEWLEILKEHNIGWMYNCVHNILGPKGLIWLNGGEDSIAFENFSEWGDYGYVVNDDVMNLLKKYQ